MLEHLQAAALTCARRRASKVGAGVSSFDGKREIDNSDGVEQRTVICGLAAKRRRVPSIGDLCQTSQGLDWTRDSVGLDSVGYVRA